LKHLLQKGVVFLKKNKQKHTNKNTKKNPAKQKTTKPPTFPIPSLLMNYFNDLSKLCTLVLVNLFSPNSQVLAWQT